MTVKSPLLPRILESDIERLHLGTPRVVIRLGSPVLVPSRRHPLRKSKDPIPALLDPILKGSGAGPGGRGRAGAVSGGNIWNPEGPLNCQAKRANKVRPLKMPAYALGILRSRISTPTALAEEGRRMPGSVCT